MKLERNLICCILLLKKVYRVAQLKNFNDFDIVRVGAENEIRVLYSPIHVL